MGYNNHRADADVDPEAAWEKTFPFWWTRIADLPAMVAQAFSCPLYHMHRYTSMVVIAERSYNKATQWAVAQSCWCTRVHNFYRFVSFFFDQRDVFRHDTQWHSLDSDAKDMACMVWYVSRFYASQSVPLGLHYCNMLFLTGHTPAMVQRLRVDDRFLPTIKNANDEVPADLNYQETWNIADYGIPADAQERRNFPMPPGTVPEGAQNYDSDYWHSELGQGPFFGPIHRRKVETTYLCTDGNLTLFDSERGRLYTELK